MQPYVILAPDHIGEVMRGERTTLPVLDAAPVGTVIAIKRAYSRRPTCLVRVTDCQPDDDGHVLSVVIQPLDHEPRLLAADSSRGYTHDPRLALAGEGEAVDAWTQDRITMDALGRDAKRRRANSIAAKRDRELLSIVERIELAKAAARENRVVIHSEVKAITRMQANGRSDGLVDQQLERIERLAHRDAA